MIKEATRPPFLEVRRKVALKLGHIPLPCETRYVGGGIENARRLIDEGYGLIVQYNHFSLRDSLHIAGDVLFADKKIGRKKILTPLPFINPKNQLTTPLRLCLISIWHH